MAAVVDLHGFKLSGLLAWWFWLAAHVFFLIGFRNRLIVLLNWAWAYWSYQRARADHPGAGQDERGRGSKRYGAWIRRSPDAFKANGPVSRAVRIATADAYAANSARIFFSALASIWRMRSARDAVLVGQFLQRDLAVGVEPAALDDVARARVEAGQAFAQQLRAGCLPRRRARRPATGSSSSRRRRYATGDGGAWSSSSSSGASKPMSRPDRRDSISSTSRSETLRSRATARTSSAFIQPRRFLDLRRLKNSLRCALVVATLTMRQLLEDELVHLGADPVHRERHQAHALVGVETLDRLHQADVAFLDQVADLQAVAVVAARDVHDEAQVRDAPARVRRRGLPRRGSGARAPARPRRSAPGCGAPRRCRRPASRARSGSAGCWRSGRGSWSLWVMAGILAVGLWSANQAREVHGIVLLRPVRS